MLIMFKKCSTTTPHLIQPLILGKIDSKSVQMTPNDPKWPLRFFDALFRSLIYNFLEKLPNFRDFEITWWWSHDLGVVHMTSQVTNGSLKLSSKNYTFSSINFKRGAEEKGWFQMRLYPDSYPKLNLTRNNLYFYYGL